MSVAFWADTVGLRANKQREKTAIAGKIADGFKNFMALSRFWGFAFLCNP
jgi:hypothetical protein